MKAITLFDKFGVAFPEVFKNYQYPVSWIENAEEMIQDVVPVLKSKSAQALGLKKEDLISSDNLHIWLTATDFYGANFYSLEYPEVFIENFAFKENPMALTWWSAFDRNAISYHFFAPFYALNNLSLSSNFTKNDFTGKRIHWGSDIITNSVKKNFNLGHKSSTSNDPLKADFYILGKEEKDALMTVKKVMSDFDKVKEETFVITHVNNRKLQSDLANELLLRGYDSLLWGKIASPELFIMFISIIKPDGNANWKYQDRNWRTDPITVGDQWDFKDPEDAKAFWKLYCRWVFNWWAKIDPSVKMGSFHLGWITQDINPFEHSSFCPALTDSTQKCCHQCQYYDVEKMFKAIETDLEFPTDFGKNNGTFTYDKAKKQFLCPWTENSYDQNPYKEGSFPVFRNGVMQHIMRDFGADCDFPFTWAPAVPDADGQVVLKTDEDHWVYRTKILEMTKDADQWADFIVNLFYLFRLVDIHKQNPSLVFVDEADMLSYLSSTGTTLTGSLYFNLLEQITSRVDVSLKTAALSIEGLNPTLPEVDGVYLYTGNGFSDQANHLDEIRNLNLTSIQEIEMIWTNECRTLHFDYLLRCLGTYSEVSMGKLPSVLKKYMNKLKNYDLAFEDISNIHKILAKATGASIYFQRYHGNEKNPSKLALASFEAMGILALPIFINPISLCDVGFGYGSGFPYMNETWTLPKSYQSMGTVSNWVQALDGNDGDKASVNRFYDDCAKNGIVSTFGTFRELSENVLALLGKVTAGNKKHNGFYVDEGTHAYLADVEMIQGNKITSNMVNQLFMFRNALREVAEGISTPQDLGLLGNWTSDLAYDYLNILNLRALALFLLAYVPLVTVTPSDDGQYYTNGAGFKTPSVKKCLNVVKQKFVNMEALQEMYLYLDDIFSNPSTSKYDPVYKGLQILLDCVKDDGVAINSLFNGKYVYSDKTSVNPSFTFFEGNKWLAQCQSVRENLYAKLGIDSVSTELYSIAIPLEMF